MVVVVLVAAVFVVVAVAVVRLTAISLLPTATILTVRVVRTRIKTCFATSACICSTIRAVTTVRLCNTS